jgi:putative endonuclease
MARRSAGHPVGPGSVTKGYYVYILASARNGTLYIGMTNDLAGRMGEHLEGVIPGFTKKYGIKTLVYYETFEDVNDAIHRETRLKKFKRAWKPNLIEQHNPDWQDLTSGL